MQPPHPLRSGSGFEQRPTSCQRICITMALMASLMAVFIMAAVWPYNQTLKSV